MTTRSTSTRTAVIAAVLLLPALLAGCSGGGTTSDPSPTPSAHAAGAVGDCMRDKGYDIDDSELAGKPAAGGGAGFAVPDGVDPDQWTADLVTCSGAAVEAGRAQAAKPLPGASDAFAKCLRDGGFDDYPDDESARATYHPADQDAFDRVSEECDDEVVKDLEQSGKR